MRPTHHIKSAGRMRHRLRAATASHAQSHGPSALVPRSGRHVILFLAANPTGTGRLALEQECAAIERELHMTTGRDDFDFRSKWAVGVDEVMRSLNELQPTIIHFSGHGSDANLATWPKAAGERGGVAAEAAGIQLQDDLGAPQHVDACALAKMIRSAAPSARVAVLNACYSDAMAAALCDVVDCVVGMTGAIGDTAARSFAVGFYRALGHRRSIGNAVDQAVATLAAKRLPGEHLPACRTREGVDARRVTLQPISNPG